MAFNVPVFDTGRLSFGPGILYIGKHAPSAAGGTPTIDIGSVRSGMTLTTTRTRLDVKQGSPATTIKTYVTAEEVRLEITGIEFNLSNLALALGAGVTSVSGKTEFFGFGGDMDVTDISLKFVHRTPAGATEEIRIWKAQGGGELARAFGDDVHEFPYTFIAVESPVDWLNQPLPNKQRLYQIVYTTP